MKKKWTSTPCTSIEMWNPIWNQPQLWHMSNILQIWGEFLYNILRNCNNFTSWEILTSMHQQILLGRFTAISNKQKYN